VPRRHSLSHQPRHPRAGGDLLASGLAAARLFAPDPVKDEYSPLQS